MRFRGWSHGLPKEIQDGGGRPPSLIFEKISITPDWINISATNFVGRCTEDMQR